LRARLTADLVDALDHAEELWLCGAADEVADRIAATEGELAAAARADARGAGVADALVTLLAGATSLVVLGIVGAAAHRGALDALLAAPLTLVALASFEIVHPVAAGARSVDAAGSAAARVLELARRRPELHDPDVPAPEPGQRPTITTERLVVDRGTGAARTRALNEVSLALGPGERLVVRGPSGSGKSTLLLTLARFLERSAGDARLAGRDLHAYAQRDVRAEVVLLAQDPHVFDSTIRENVALARPGCTDDDVRDALGRAQLGAFVASLPDGLDTRVGASGRALSGGQRQRLAMARAFLAGGSVLLIDEPTAHLDQTTACRLLTDLWNAAEDRSVLLVTHGDPGPFHDCRTLQVEAVAPDHRPPH
jgi:ABC-type transport system involved in cytochrome bd biosynthesis fused ATPase/permease subunit